MKDGKNRNKNENEQLDLFTANQPAQTPQSPGNVEEPQSKIVSIVDFRHQQEIKKFYEVANKATSHLNK